jgi:ATP-dependent Zn protease
MVKKAISIIIPLIIGILISYWIFNRNENKAVNTSGDVIIERIKAVKKLVVTEGQFSEVYNYKEAQKYFYNLISFEKRPYCLLKEKCL